jgi:hypothetical protein
VFRFSAAQVRWNKAELDHLRSLWVQAYKRAEYLPKGTASDIFSEGAVKRQKLFPPITQIARNDAQTRRPCAAVLADGRCDIVFGRDNKGV